MKLDCGTHSVNGVKFRLVRRNRPLSINRLLIRSYVSDRFEHKNIDELLETLHGTFHRIRQAGIDEELFDVISGFEALSKWNS
jgi:hypothetical protein